MDKYNLRLNVPIRLTLQCYQRRFVWGVQTHERRIVRPCNATNRDLSGVCKHMNGELSDPAMLKLRFVWGVQTHERRIVRPCNATEFCLGCENQPTEKCPDGELTVIRL